MDPGTTLALSNDCRHNVHLSGRQEEIVWCNDVLKRAVQVSGDLRLPHGAASQTTAANDCFPSEATD